MVHIQKVDPRPGIHLIGGTRVTGGTQGLSPRTHFICETRNPTGGT